MKWYSVTDSSIPNTMDIHAERSNFSTVLETIPSGSVLQADLQSDPPEHFWVRVKYGAVTGWMKRQKDVVTWKPVDEPQPEPPTLPAADDPRWTAAHAAPRNSNVNIRPDPSTNQRAVGQLKSGDGITDVFTIPALKHTDTDGFTWHLIQVPRAAPIIGYVRGDVADVRLTSVVVAGAVDVLKQWQATTERTIDRLNELAVILANEIELQRIIVRDIDKQLEGKEQS